MSVDLDELDRLLREATPGPWAHGTEPDQECVILPSGEWFAVREDWHDPRGHADAALIVWLRNNAQAMRDELLELRAEVERQTKRCTCCRQELYVYVNTEDEICAECFPGMVHSDGTPCPATEDA